MGKAVVSTTLGCEGLEARDGENILICDSPEAFATAAVTLLEDAALRGRIGLAARRLAERTYDWAAIGENLASSYCAMLEQQRGAAGTT